MLEATEALDPVESGQVSGDFIHVNGEQYYVVRNVDKIAPFFVSVISSQDHWLFVSSTGGLTAGRVSPETALFPYITVDRVHESAPHTGSKTLVRTETAGNTRVWEPFGADLGNYSCTRNLYKNLLGNKLCFEEINLDLKLVFRYTWTTSEEFGFCKQCEIENLSTRQAKVEILDGIQNILPAGTPRIAQTNASNLVDAYKWTEFDQDSGLAIFTLYSGVSDRAAPSESLKANTVFCLGLKPKTTLLSSSQLGDFRRGMALTQENHTRGIRGAFFVESTLDLKAEEKCSWSIVADVEQSQSRVTRLQKQLKGSEDVTQQLSESIQKGTDELAQIMAAADGFQATAEDRVSAHHYANVLYNVLRGGIFHDQYTISTKDFTTSVRHFNKLVYRRHKQLLNQLPESLSIYELLDRVTATQDAQFERLCREYLPITFGRRHGDPSRPWNDFAIKVKTQSGEPLLSYQGNWRDIFQNWEALTFSYPEFAENTIAKFVNASTMDGYNPYRITKEGIDWEVEDPKHPWSYIGYWGDHQIIYLLKLLELSQQFHPERLTELLHRSVFSYANVPYRIASFQQLLINPKDTVSFDFDLADDIKERVKQLGADGKLILDGNSEVYQVNLLEKLLVPLLGKLSNLVVDGGIWLNTQRPEWNDANNALVGQGLSMVTLYYIRRYVELLNGLLSNETDDIEISKAVADWLNDTSAALANVGPVLGSGQINDAQRYALLDELGNAACRYRTVVYEKPTEAGKTKVTLKQIRKLLHHANAAIDHSINTNRREDGLFHAYNLLECGEDGVSVGNLYPMLEGQVAAISSGTVSAKDTCEVLEALFASDIYRADQDSFMLYPDRKLPTFLEKNQIPKVDLEAIPLLTTMLSRGDERLVAKDVNGYFRFSSEFHNADDLTQELEDLSGDYEADEIEGAKDPLLKLYEKVFNHRAFTGRSGGMFGFEGLGCIYWHMVSKLLLAAQESFFAALQDESDQQTIQRLAGLYYRIRGGLGFNKTPAEYGAFPMDPYSHTPKHAGARQPGMTGLVKEEILTRFGELGVRVNEGCVKFDTRLLRPQEFTKQATQLRYLDTSGSWREIPVAAKSLAFTWCQTPIVYTLSDTPSVTITLGNGDTQQTQQLTLSKDTSKKIFMRTGQIEQITVAVSDSKLFKG
ncbi:MAG: hypothetical protein AAF438_00040 [Pseudomonadota bacterium]